MASCNLCKSFGPTKIQYNYELATAHAKSHYLQVKIVDDGIDMNQIFGQCFPDFVPINAGSGSGNSGRRHLTALCQSLFGRKSRMTQVVCEKCDEEIKILQPRVKRLNSNVLIDHACFHLNLNIYECCHCIREFRSIAGVKLHLAKKHELHSSVGHFRCKIDDFVEELLSMIKECFGGKKKMGHSNGITTGSVSQPQIRTRTTGSKLTDERQLYCYRLIRKVADRNGRVECRLCSKRISATKNLSIQCEHVKTHAYRHLPTPLYRCRLCSEVYFGRCDLDKHLRVIHALPSLGNFEWLADEHHSDVLAMMNKCYGTENESAKEITFRNLSESKVLRNRSTRSKLADQRQLLCHRLIRKCVSAERLVQCRLCSKQISTKLANASPNVKSVMEHAFLHLGKKLYKCNKCSNSFVTSFGIWTHLKKEHALSMNQTYYECFADQFHADIESILRQCYEDEEAAPEGPTSVQLEPDESMSLLPSKMTIDRWTLCNQLTREHCDRKDKKIHCRLCNKRISVKTIRGIGGEPTMTHALVHLSKPMYRCRICSETFITRNNVGFHVKKKHALPFLNNYDCSADQFHADIVDMLSKCYNKEAASESVPFRSQAKAEASVRRTMDGSKQAAERQLFCYRLIRKFIDSDGKVECRLCKKRVGAMAGEYHRSNSVMVHALLHLKKPVYRCLVCSEKRHVPSSIRQHLRKMHALPFANNYESSADKYHSEILAQLRECYGEL